MEIQAPLAAVIDWVLRFNKLPDIFVISNLGLSYGLRKNEKARLRRSKGLPQSIIDFVQETNGLFFEWQSVATINGKPIQVGAVQIQDFSSIFSPWKGIIDFGSKEPADAWRKSFKIIDFIFGAEKCVGFYYDERNDNQLYYYPFEGLPLALGVDFPGYLAPGYLALLAHSMAGEHWHRVLLELSSTPDDETYTPQSAEAKAYVAGMTSVVPGFNLDNLVKCYAQVRLRN
ncbi:SMI1/KNR4 family protein [Hymenobacter sp. ASUV-10]|uniref:SMI1/KNR4 family protein n=1 Tax=Hymenobacter aranciens TaxID=3063996 RepID=A0ABT9B9R5_9BACT|nr:SMI1/KNR4 family protein [Hymenobacter sp. ASUV-10]MDO7873777.1 SMI1/KNR4 family protein [Hymenobacter sp. ASUV-10]